MDKITKFLKQLSSNERMLVLKAISQIINKETKGMVPKKLKGFSDLYRVRINKIRIIFRKESDQNKIVNIDY